jgi:uncharacterized membrane protein SpoIIM required for sporulation
MVEQASRHEAQDLSGHVRTYEGFLKGSIILAIVSLLVLIALVNVGFGHSAPIFMAFAGIIIGVLALLIDLRAGGTWKLPIAVLVIYGILTAMNIS